MKKNLLEIQDLSLAFIDGDKEKMILDGTSFYIDKGEIVALLGESGSGKTLCGRSILGLLPRQAKLSGSIRLIADGSGISHELLALPETAWERIRAAKISLVGQQSLASFSPTMRMKKQLMSIEDGAKRKDNDKKLREKNK